MILTQAQTMSLMLQINNELSKYMKRPELMMQSSGFKGI